MNFYIVSLNGYVLALGDEINHPSIAILETVNIPDTFSNLEMLCLVKEQVADVAFKSGLKSMFHMLNIITKPHLGPELCFCQTEARWFHDAYTLLDFLAIIESLMNEGDGFWIAQNSDLAYCYIRLGSVYTEAMTPLAVEIGKYRVTYKSHVSDFLDTFFLRTHDDYGLGNGFIYLNQERENGEN